MFRLYHASSKLEALVSLAKTAPLKATKFRFSKSVPPPGYMVEFGTGGKESDGWFSLEQVQKAFGLYVEEPAIAKPADKGGFADKELLQRMVSAKMSQRYAGKILEPRKGQRYMASKPQGGFVPIN